MRHVSLQPQLLLAAYDDARCVARRPVSASETTLDFARARWRLRWQRRSVSTETERWELEVCVMQGTSAPCAVGFVVTIPEWSSEHYLLMPGAVYAGNRFECRKLVYSPRHPEADCRPDVPTLITDIPRLNYGEGPSRIQLLAGGMSRPAVGLFDPHEHSAWLVLSAAQTKWGEVGFDFEENAERTEAELRVTVPGVRERRYVHMHADAESPDRGRVFGAGDEVRLTLEVHSFGCADVTELFARLFATRRVLLPPPVPPTELPASVAWGLIEEHYNRDFWWEDAGLYRTSLADGWGQNPYATGWCGGVIAEYALLAAAREPVTRQRVYRHLGRALTEGIAPGGLFYAKFNNGRWQSDGDGDAARPWRKNHTLVRRQGDALWYALRAIALLEARGESVPASWLAGTRAVAEALVRVWQRNGQFGQWVDQFSGEVRVGNSTSGALIPAALVEAWRRFGEPAMLAVAEESATWFCRQFTRRGVTTGGPGDCLQCPDSESSYALVESYVALWEALRDEVWLERATIAAQQFASWVMPYDYRFGEETEFGRLGIKTTGTVFANAQNAHSAPGICTHAGLGLFKLFRATGDVRYLDLVSEIARALPQFVSRADRPIVASDGRQLPTGWINERCNTSDWDNNRGGVFWGPCWCEVSLLLTVADLPGIYVRGDDSIVGVFDNLEVSRTADAVQIKNPTRFPAGTMVQVEVTEDGRENSTGDCLVRTVPVAVASGEAVLLSLREKGQLGGARVPRPVAQGGAVRVIERE
ncbi:MAG: hypothetical protein NZ483_05940 [Verrucomicrobiae bacterium]|nr:hypothetical protein [Verrucomicrobiae bacterium]